MTALPPVKKFVSRSGIRIYRIPCQVFQYLSGRVYLILGAGPPTLLDAGSGLGACTRHILAGINIICSDFGEKIQPEHIKRIIISHGHVDHVCGLPDLLAVMKAEVAVHQLDLKAVAAHREHITVADSLLSRFLQHAGTEPDRAATLRKIFVGMGKMIGNVSVGRVVHDGETLDGLKIIHTPGHSPGHICLLAEDILLASDHILSQTIPQQWPEFTMPFTGLGHYFDSLNKIANLPGIKLTLAAHEQTIHDVYGRIETIRAAHQRRLERLIDMLKTQATPLSIDEITQKLYPEATDVRAVLAITDVGSRVEYLHQRHQLAIVNLEELARNPNAVPRYQVVKK